MTVQQIVAVTALSGLEDLAVSAEFGQRDRRRRCARASRRRPISQNVAVGSLLGSIVDTVLVRGLQLFEHVYPMPARLGAPLAGHQRARSDADPVVLIGGFANSTLGWQEWRRSLEQDGFQVFVFDPPTYGLGDMEQSARDVAAFIEEVRRRTGRRKVDVVGFSEGGILLRMAVARHGQADGIDRLISLATPHGGVSAGSLGDAVAGSSLLRRVLPESMFQLIAGSALLASIEREDARLRARGGVHAPRYASLFSRVSDIVVTPASGWLDGATNVPIAADNSWQRGPNHFQMFHTSSRAYDAALVLLLDGSPVVAVLAGAGALQRRAVSPASRSARS
jgi:pimeloyl-ACP methyl ester carboxylesterase